MHGQCYVLSERCIIPVVELVKSMAVCSTMSWWLSLMIQQPCTAPVLHCQLSCAIDDMEQWEGTILALPVLDLASHDVFNSLSPAGAVDCFSGRLCCALLQMLQSLLGRRSSLVNFQYNAQIA